MRRSMAVTEREAEALREEAAGSGIRAACAERGGGGGAGEAAWDAGLPRAAATEAGAAPGGDAGADRVAGKPARAREAFAAEAERLGQEREEMLAQARESAETADTWASEQGDGRSGGKS